MSNKIKTTGTTTKLIATRNTNFKIGVDGSDDYGPTSIFGFYNGITPPVGGYTIYVHKENQGPSIHVANDDNQCIYFLKSFGATGNTINEVLNWSTGRTDMWVQSADLTSIDLDTPPSSLVTDSLRFHLDASNSSSYSGTGTTWTDLQGNHNGTISGATWSSMDGGIFDFDGINDSVSIAHNSNLSLNTSTQRTIQVWVKFDSFPALNAQMPVFGKLSSSFSFDGYWGGLFSNGGKIRVVTNGVSTQKVSDSTLTISTNTWYLFTFISQITNVSNTTKAYINTTEYISTAHGSDTINESNPLFLGYIGNGVGSLFLDGKIGACYFYTKGLSSSEVSQNFDATKSRYGL